ncbi:MAG: MarR family transcriptional regulator [Bacteroidales bacterium]|nr:MarR family transcriptional regulator [Bacteroidales bacterium]
MTRNRIMVATIVIKSSEKVLLWLHREGLTMTWLAKKLGQTKQAVSQKIKGNGFSDLDLSRIKELGCPL